MVFIFYINHGGEYYRASIKSNSRDSVERYLEGISKEVVYKGSEEEGIIEEKCHKKIPCGELVQYKYYGNVLPKGLAPDKRYTIWQDT